MDIIASIVELAKERDDLDETVDRYEEWFSELIGKTATVTLNCSRRHKKFVDVEIVSFDSEGWMCHVFETGKKFRITWDDISGGYVSIHSAANA